MQPMQDDSSDEFSTDLGNEGQTLYRTPLPYTSPPQWMRLSLIGRVLSAKTAGLHSTTSPLGLPDRPAHGWHSFSQAY
jgi:hypothetical protein